MAANETAPAFSARSIAGFEILEKLGQGGMGAVFRARQVSMDRIVALKILPPKLAQDPTFKKRFLNEARVCARLSHLNIINGIDCGEAGGYTYFAMEFVQGQTIKQIMKEKGKFDPSEALQIIRQMVEALAYAKEQGLVHRDVKPDNIMMTPDGVAKLCDLGLAKKVEGNDDSSLTQAGQAVGTPHYISPEQARGETVEFGSDIYSLGATFYHMLTGKTPFDAPTSAAIMALHIAGEFKSPCEIEPGIPIGYGQVIAKMMAKAPADRYPSPEGLITDLDALQKEKAPAAAAFKAKSFLSDAPPGSGFGKRRAPSAHHRAATIRRRAQSKGTADAKQRKTITELDLGCHRRNGVVSCRRGSGNERQYDASGHRAHCLRRRQRPRNSRRCSSSSPGHCLAGRTEAGSLMRPRMPGRKNRMTSPAPPAVSRRSGPPRKAPNTNGRRKRNSSRSGSAATRQLPRLQNGSPTKPMLWPPRKNTIRPSPSGRTSPPTMPACSRLAPPSP